MIYPLRLTDGVLFIDNSTLSLIHECFRKAAYGVSLRKKADRSEAALQFGKIIHSCLEERYSRNALTITSEVENKMFKRAQAEFLNYQPPEGDFRNLDQAIECITQYNLHYFRENFEILSVNGHQGTETPFAVPLAEININDELWVQDVTESEPHQEYISTLPVMFTGRIDLVIRDSLGVWIFDHKTTSIGGSHFFSEFYTATQFKGYIWALKQLTGIQAQGAIINGLVNRRPLKSGKMNIEFLRDHIHIAAPLVDEWHTDFLNELYHYIDCIASQQFPQQTSACVSKYGKCEFYDVCVLPPAQREMMLSTGQFVDRTWDPILQEEAAPVTPYMP